MPIFEVSWMDMNGKWMTNGHFLGIILGLSESRVPLNLQFNHYYPHQKCDNWGSIPHFRHTHISYVSHYTHSYPMHILKISHIWIYNHSIWGVWRRLASFIPSCPTWKTSELRSSGDVVGIWRWEKEVPCNGEYPKSSKSLNYCSIDTHDSLGMTYLDLTWSWSERWSHSELENHNFLVGKSTNSMAIFHCYVGLPEGPW